MYVRARAVYNFSYDLLHRMVELGLAPVYAQHDLIFISYPIYGSGF